MTSTSMLPAFGTLLALASAWDVARHRIPNALVVGLAVAGLASRALDGGPGAVGSGAVALIGVGAVVWPAWARRWIGGGDLKLAAATAAWLGVGRVPLYLVASAIAIGAVAAVSWAASAPRARTEVRRNLALAMRGIPIVAPIGAEEGRAQVPAGLGFAIGAVAALVLSGGA